MTRNDFVRRLDAATPPVPEVFHEKMQDTLSSIVIAEGTSEAKPVRRAFHRRTAALLIALALLLAGAAVAAAIHFDLLNVFWGNENMTGVSDSFFQRDLAHVSVGDCDVDVKEAAYDGVSLYILYSIRDRTATRLLGQTEEGDPSGLRYLGEDDYAMLEKNNVGWWTDTLWINGVSIDIPGMTSWNEYGGDQPGEILYYQLYRMDQSPLTLEGQVTVSMPIGERQPSGTLMFDDTGHAPLPSKGIVSFTLDCSDLHGVTVTHPEQRSIFPDGTAVWISQANFTPVKLYLTLAFDVPDSAVEAYKQQMGSDGVYDEQGSLLYEYSAMDCATWIYSMQLVDGEGHQVFERLGFADGCWGMGNSEAWFVAPYADEYPSPMYLAPVDESGQADMTRAVRVK